MQNLEIKKINDEKKASMAAQFAAEATLRRVHAAQKDDDMPPIEAILAPLEAELKLARQEVKWSNGFSILHLHLPLPVQFFVDCHNSTCIFKGERSSTFRFLSLFINPRGILLLVKEHISKRPKKGRSIADGKAAR